MIVEATQRRRDTEGNTAGNQENHRIVMLYVEQMYGEYRHNQEDVRTPQDQEGTEHKTRFSDLVHAIPIYFISNVLCLQLPLVRKWIGQHHFVHSFAR